MKEEKDTLTLIHETFQSFLASGHADQAIHHTFRSNRLTDDRERGEIVHTIKGLIRWWRPLSEATRIENPQSKYDTRILVNALQYWEQLPNPKVKIKHEQTADRLRRYHALPKMQAGMPDWMYDKGNEQYGERWQTIAESLNEDAPHDIRINTLLCKSENDLLASLESEGVQASPIEDLPGGYEIVHGYERLFRTSASRAGWFEMQDRSSQLVAHLLQVKSGMKIIDACAGNGGKSLHLASLMRNKGKIVALDNDEKKLLNLKKRAAKNNVDIVEVYPANTGNMEQLKGYADRLLLDVPCSGSGVIRRNPELKWNTSPSELEKLKSIQRNIMDRYAAMLNEKGIMMYVTCSIFKDENEEQVAHFLKTHPDWELLSEKMIDPSDKFSGDGFYIATLQTRKSAN
ncbi:MAG: RsmB/NOP family class I SAM-dependent RNA methyltransferase [Bacteroidetes bacterium]|jgi:16S rRNA (cytosine967-C5)-methyltransferase|nr:RsmB/NOP family class I SAM-dependent RNA methyltransferase [Bacteroidota bacterium]